tara:strand:+ start:230 stop:925 length:696 start_codon:yes stop_codon:yes gene_type:complete
MHTLQGLHACTVLGLLGEWLTLATVEWIVRVHCRTGSCENLWRHADPDATFFAQPCDDPAIITMWVSGRSPCLMVHYVGGATTTYPVPIAAIVCVCWRDTCVGIKSGYVCTADKRVASFMLELADPPDTCNCLQLDGAAVGQLQWDHRYELPAVPRCGVVVTLGAVDTVYYGMAESILTIESTGTVAVFQTSVPGGVHSIVPISNNAFHLETGNGPRRFTMDTVTNVADLS